MQLLQLCTTVLTYQTTYFNVKLNTHIAASVV